MGGGGGERGDKEKRGKSEKRHCEPHSKQARLYWPYPFKHSAKIFGENAAWQPLLDLIVKAHGLFEALERNTASSVVAFAT